MLTARLAEIPFKELLFSFRVANTHHESNSQEFISARKKKKMVTQLRSRSLLPIK